MLNGSDRKTVIGIVQFVAAKIVGSAPLQFES